MTYPHVKFVLIFSPWAITWQKRSLGRVALAGRAEILNYGPDDKQLGVWRRNGAQVFQDFKTVRITPIVYDILQNECCRLFDSLRIEEIMACICCIEKN